LKRVKYFIEYFPFWNCFKLYGQLVDFLFRHKNELESDLRKNAETEIPPKYFNDRTVRGGIFKGLKYPELRSHGSALFAKLAGTYESVLGPLFTSQRFQQYDLIVDVGCAEGYYAVGSLLLNSHVKVIAVDTDTTALSFCKEMATLNGVLPRIAFSTSVDWSILQATNQSVLVICDCEGCEAELFNETTLRYLTKCDLIIELHDFLRPGIKKKLIDLFDASHKAITIKENGSKAKLSFVGIFRALHHDLITEEQRPTKMEWLILERK
jgi:hypothetical protein